MKYLLPSVIMTLITLLLFGIAFPLLITLIASLIAPGGGGGEEIAVNGRVVGYELIGQNFGSERYFSGRPSAVIYNASATGGSNKGPSNPEYLAGVQARIDTFLRHNPAVTKSQIPVDLVTASGGGLDPHISPNAALVQVPRIAQHRGIAENILRSLVQEHIETPLLGLGPARVHVLRLNLALDELK